MSQIDPTLNLNDMPDFLKEFNQEVNEYLSQLIDPDMQGIRITDTKISQSQLTTDLSLELLHNKIILTEKQCQNSDSYEWDLLDNRVYKNKADIAPDDLYRFMKMVFILLTRALKNKSKVFQIEK